MIESPDPQAQSQQLRKAFIISSSFAAILWIIKIIENLLNTSFVKYGIYPGQLEGLIGIAFAPLIHSSWPHLFSNTGPILILGTALIYGYPRSAKIMLPISYLSIGIGVWLFARPVHHIGASGLTFSMMFFIFTIGALRWDKLAIALAMSVFFLYGSMLEGLVPANNQTSYETHLAGAAIGITMAFLLKTLDPPPPQKKYSWEDEEEITENSLENATDDLPFDDTNKLQ